MNRVRFVHILSILMVLISGTGGFFVIWSPDFAPEIKGSVVTLMLVGGYTAIQNYWLGSSAGSERKDRIAASDRAGRQDGDV